MTPAEILKAARAKIEKPENWCQGEWGIDVHGRPVVMSEAGKKDACAWCSEGALMAVLPDMSSDEYTECFFALRDAAREIGGWISIVSANDHMSHPEVLQMFDLAIEKAEGRG